ncbi:unnamed protein product, partial [Chrysoparadoxa australica]
MQGYERKEGGIFTVNDLEGLTHRWTIGDGKCFETEVVYEWLEELMWGIADETMDDAYCTSYGPGLLATGVMVESGHDSRPPELQRSLMLAARDLEPLQRDLPEARSLVFG